MGKRREKFYVEPDSLFAHGAIIFLVLAAVFCLLGSIGSWNDNYFVVTKAALPVICIILYIVLFSCLGSKALWTTAIPVIPGMVFFILNEFSYGSVLYTAIAVAFSVITVFLYLTAVFGWIKTKLPLICVLIAGFFYHIYVRDYAALSVPSAQVSFAAVMQEIAVIFIILGFLCVSFAMKNSRTIESMNLPKMKAPKVIIKTKEEEKAAQDAQEEKASEIAEVSTEEKITGRPEESKIEELPMDNTEVEAVNEVPDSGTESEDANKNDEKVEPEPPK